MKTHVGSFVWIESVLASLTCLLTTITLVRRDWIEAILGFEADGHSGSFEWELTISFGLATLFFAALAWREWSRATTAR